VAILVLVVLLHGLGVDLLLRLLERPEPPGSDSALSARFVEAAPVVVMLPEPSPLPAPPPTRAPASAPKPKPQPRHTAPAQPVGARPGVPALQAQPAKPGPPSPAQPGAPAPSQSPAAPGLQV
jgi:hypothetical protein